MKSTDEEIPPLIPAGTYELKFEGYSTGILFGKSSKLILSFRIIDMNEHFETKILAYYNVQRLIGKPGKNGNFKSGWSSKFTREFINLFGIRPQRLDRIPMSHFDKQILIGQAKTVKQGHNQKKLHPAAQYSVISELIEVKKI